MERLTGYYISYQRMSTLEQLKGDSLRRQTKQLQDFLDNHDLIEADTVIDINKSGFHGNHLKEDQQGGFHKILAAIRNGDLDTNNTDYYLIIEALDRFSRQEIILSLSLFLEVLRSGVKIITLFDGKIYDKKANQLSIMTALVHLEQAHNESKKKSIRIGEVFQEKREEAKEGKLFTTRAPSWLRVEGKVKDGTAKYIIREERANIIRAIFDKSVNENYGKEKICDYLNNTLKVKSFSGKTWTASSIAKLLRDRRLVGYYQPHTYDEGGTKRVPIGDEIPNFYPKIIDIALFQASREKSKSRLAGEQVLGGRIGKSTNLFKGLVKCAVCGSNCHLENQKYKNISYLKCSNATCTNKRVRYEYFEKAFFYLITEINVANLLSDNNLSREQQRARQEIKEHEFRKDEVQAQINNLTKAIALGGNIQELVTLINQLKDEEKQLNEKIQLNEAVLNKTIENSDSFTDLKKLYHKLKSEDDIRLRVKISNVIKEYIHGIAIHGHDHGKLGAVFFKPEKVKALLKDYCDIRDNKVTIVDFRAMSLDLAFAIPADRKLYNMLDKTACIESEVRSRLRLSESERMAYSPILELETTLTTDFLNTAMAEFQQTQESP